MDSVYERLLHLNTKFKLIKLTPAKVAGVPVTTKEEIGSFYANFQTYGGTATQVNGITVYENTGEATTHFRPDITQDCIVLCLNNNKEYEIISEPENYLMENRALILKLRKLEGKYGQ